MPSDHSGVARAKKPEWSRTNPAWSASPSTSGRAHGVQPGDFVGVIAGVTAIPKGEIGAIHLQATKTLVDVAEPRVALILKKLNGIQFKGRKLAVRLASQSAKHAKTTPV